MPTQGTVIERTAADRETAPTPLTKPAKPTEAAKPSTQQPLPRKIGRTLLFLAPLTGDAGLVSLAVLTHEFSCDSMLCSTTTLGRHPGVVLVLSGVYLAALYLLAVLTRRFTEAGWPHLAAAGVLALVLTAFAVLATGLAFLALFLLATGRFRPTTPHR